MIRFILNMKREIMKKQQIVLSLMILSTHLSALVDVEAEINAPVAEMKMLDDAMNKGIDEQRERNARRPMIIEDEMRFHQEPMFDFVLKGDSYILEKNVLDVNNTEIKTKLENRMLTITEVKKIEELIVEDSATLGTNSTQKRFFESTTSQTLSLPNDADEKTLESYYNDGLLKVRVQKK
ncbi:MAG: Unknown protein [uncultured Sulfurovum sp.]|uniref:SHSP domain-containing protein n=1 Tax=uncultured Sulfurovum sp. TaxID=269237 RepID=A0A6S6SI55_9BACT|nr:MAG: Unknown protein [uncultured Sulfurovum sp.]